MAAAERRRIIELARSGLKLREVARMMRRPHSTVRGVVWQASLAGELPRRKMEPLTNREIKQMRRLAESGVTMAEAARVMHRSHDTIRNWAKREGIEFLRRQATTMWQHHPDCGFWFEQYPFECTCGLTAVRPPGSTLEKWTRAQWAEWVDGVLRQATKSSSTP